MAKPLFESFSLFHLSVFCEAVSLARLVKAEIVCPPFTGFSSIQTWVTQSCPLACFLDYRRVPSGYGEGSWYSTSYKETRALLLFSNPKTSSPVASSSNTLGSRFRAPQTFDNVRFRPSRPMDALLHHGRGRAKAEGPRYLTYEISHRLPA